MNAVGAMGLSPVPKEQATQFSDDCQSCAPHPVHEIGCSTCATTQRIQQQWQNYAMKLCDPLVKKYWVCRQETGFMVVFKCRDELKEMRECVASHTRDEASFAAFRAERMRVIEEVMGSGGYVRPSHREFKIPSKNK